MGVDPAVVLADPVWIGASVFGLLLLKGSVLFVLCRMFRLPKSVAAEVALTAGQAGEFAFVIVGLATTLGVIPAPVAQFMLIVTGLTMMLTPVLTRLGRMAGARLEQPVEDLPTDMAERAADLEHHVVIAGYGRVGRMLGDLLGRESVPYIALDLAPDQVAPYRGGAVPVFVGDASRPEILERIGIHRASAFVVTMDSAAAAERVVAAVRRECPELPIYARARDTAHAVRLLSGGATHVIPETVEATLQLGEVVLTGAGLPEEAARLRVEQVRQEEKAHYVR
jgi:CPA2 family monovalent cation:H+ antiporter-2